MTRDLDSVIRPSWELLALGEPTHAEPAFGWARNQLFADLVRRGFRSVALESDRVAGLVVDDFVRNGVGTLDRAMAEGFSHDFGEHPANRALVAWLRNHNEGRPAADRVAWYGFDAPLETMNVPSPRRFLEAARDYLDPGLDLDRLLGPDERWDSSEALLDREASVGASADADRLRTVADELITTLYARAPELIKASSLAAWREIEVRLTGARQVLHYHRQAAQPLADEPRWNRMCATRDALMAQNLIDLRALEAHRGPTLVFANNLHLQRQPSVMDMGPMHLEWNGAGSIMAGLLGDRYGFVAGSLGTSPTIGLGTPASGTIEAGLQSLVDGWGLIKITDVPAGDPRADTRAEQGYCRLDQETVAAADALLHLADPTTVAVSSVP
ncbi:erythromycin esterase family protein [Microlunatus speluncae]|uniref:erythromycin esterase family protein n=1 Tax=Microlunatus speluncae TaxID=2594267 RepID=UPI0012662FA9|nr:erythromycin esterase family protein [Microlunatus speluncae]